MFEANLPPPSFLDQSPTNLRVCGRGLNLQLPAMIHVLVLVCGRGLNLPLPAIPWDRFTAIKDFTYIL